jgi:hypothetical protein
VAGRTSCTAVVLGRYTGPVALSNASSEVMMWIEDLIMTTLRDQWRNKERRQSRLFPPGRLRGLYLSCREVLGRCACAMPFSFHDRSGIYNGFHFKMVRGIVGETKKMLGRSPVNIYLSIMNLAGYYIQTTIYQTFRPQKCCQTRPLTTSITVPRVGESVP